MGDAAVDRWKLEGHFYIWRYPNRKQDGWHLNADALACQSLDTLIDLMLAAEWKTRKHIPVGVPSKMVIKLGEVWKPVTALRLCYPKSEAEPAFWCMEESEDGVLSLTVGESKLRHIQTSLRELPRWKDDFSIGPDIDFKRRKSKERIRFDMESLWFWTKIN